MPWRRILRLSKEMTDLSESVLSVDSDARHGGGVVVASPGLVIFLDGKSYRVESLHERGVVLERKKHRLDRPYGDSVETLGGRIGLLAMPQSEDDRAESLAADWLRFAFGERYGEEGQARLDLTLSGYGSLAKATEVDQLDAHTLVLLAGIDRLGPARLSFGVTVRDLEWFGTHPNSPDPRGAWTVEVFYQWVALGRSIEDLRYAVAAGLRFDLLKEWFALVDPVTDGPLSVQECLAWRRTKFSPPEAMRWITRGWPAELAEQARRLTLDPGSAAELRTVSGSFDKALELAESGITNAKDVEQWLDSGWSIERLLTWRKARFTSYEASRWLSVGVPSPSTAAEYKRAGVIPERFGEVARIVGSGSPSFDEWLFSALSVDEIGEWVHLRNVSAREATLYKSKGISPDRFAEMEVLLGREDLSFPSWARSDFDQGEIKTWMDVGVTDAARARAWIKQGFVPDQAARWLALGVSEPLNARVWTDMGYRPASTDEVAVEADLALIAELGDPVIESVEQWISSNFAPSEALLWSQGGIDPDTAWVYDRAGMTAKKIVPLLLAGLDIDNAMRWTNGRPRWDSSVIIDYHFEGRDPDVIQEWVRSGFSLREAGVWSDSLLDRSLAKKWRDSGFAVLLASQWVESGVTDPSMVSSFCGVSPGDVLFCCRSGMTQTELIEALNGAEQRELDDPISTLRAISPHVVRWRDAVADPGCWVLLARVCSYNTQLASQLFNALGSGMDPSLLSVSSLVKSRTEAFLRLLALGARVSDFAVIVRSGRSDESAIAEVTRKFAPPPPPKEPVQVKRAPTVSPPPPAGKATKSSARSVAATKWNSLARAWLRELGVALEDDIYELFEWVKGEGWEWIGNTEKIFNWFEGDSDDWMIRCQERALSSRPSMRKAVTGVKVFADQDVVIALCVFDETVVAWVGDPGTKKGLLVALREEDFVPLADRPNRRVKIASGLAMSWYVDCAVVIRAASSGPSHSFVGGPATATTSGRIERYVPAPSFAGQVRDVQNGRLRVLSGCWVSPHLRKLSAGRVPNPDHVQRAPKQLRRKMGPRDTWVTEHARLGGASEREFQNRLTKYSSLADALGLATKSR
jgi:hypothetical protein